MTLEAQPNPQRPEGISAQQQERFVQLQAGIMERLKPQRATVVYTSDSKVPIEGDRLSLNKNGRWILGFLREGIKVLNDPDKPVEFVNLLKEYAFIQESSSFDQMLEGPRIDIKECLEKIRAIKKSVDDNPGQIAESFLAQMENTLEQLSKEEKTI